MKGGAKALNMSALREEILFVNGAISHDNLVIPRLFPILIHFRKILISFFSFIVAGQVIEPHV